MKSKLWASTARMTALLSLLTIPSGTLFASYLNDWEYREILVPKKEQTKEKEKVDKDKEKEEEVGTRNIWRRDWWVWKYDVIESGFDWRKDFDSKYLKMMHKQEFVDKDSKNCIAVFYPKTYLEFDRLGHFVYGKVRSKQESGTFGNDVNGNWVIKDGYLILTLEDRDEKGHAKPYVYGYRLRYKILGTQKSGTALKLERVVPPEELSILREKRKGAGVQEIESDPFVAFDNIQFMDLQEQMSQKPPQKPPAEGGVQPEMEQKDAGQDAEAEKPQEEGAAAEKSEEAAEEAQ